MGKKETKIENDIMFYLRCNGCEVGKVKIHGRQLGGRYIFDKDTFRGFPDLVAFNKDKGKMYFIECKVQDGNLTDEQFHFAWLCGLCGVSHVIARSVEDVKGIVE